MSVADAPIDVALLRVRMIGVGYLLLSRAVLVYLMLARRALDIGELLFTVLWGLPPYLCLLLLAARIGGPILLGAALAIVAVSEAFCWYDALYPARSTAALGVFLQPIYALVFIVPATLFLGWLIRRGRRPRQRNT